MSDTQDSDMDIDTYFRINIYKKINISLNLILHTRTHIHVGPFHLSVSNKDLKYAMRSGTYNRILIMDKILQLEMQYHSRQLSLVTA